MRTVTIRLSTPTEEVTLAPLGDIQWAGDRADIAYDHLKEHVQDILRQPNPLFVGLGDYIDFASPSNREALHSVRLYDTARRVIADAGKVLVDDLYLRFLEPTTGHWAGVLEGHHHFPIRVKIADPNVEGDQNYYQHSDQYLAEKLRTSFLEEMGLIKLRWPGGGKVNILAFHGSGSSVFPWGPLNKLFRLSPGFSADIYLMGHQSKNAVGDYDEILPVDDEVSGDRLDHRTKHIVGCGAWTRGYVEGKRTYVSNAGLSPVALGHPIIHIRPRLRVTTSTGATIWEPRIRVEK